jgi:cellulose biosynthesis protein BcsQ
MPSHSPTPKRIVLFNHKGGVGKTTLTVNLAYALVNSGKRVLLVDTDPQCSMSSFFLEEKFLDKMLDDSEGATGNTLWSAIKPVSEGSGSLADITPVKIQDGLFLAVGDIRLSEYENSLAECWNLCLSRNRRGYLCTTALSRLVDNLVKGTKADYVFFDAGPNIGPLNRAVLLDCSHFVVPAACDLFSSRALKTLGYALSDWISTWQKVTEMAPDGTSLLHGTPKLLGFIPQGFRIYGGRMASAPLVALSTLGPRVIDFVWKPLQEAYGLSAKERPTKLKLGEVKDLGVLVTKSQEQGQPIWEVQGGNEESKAQAHRVFIEIAKRLVEATA